MIEKIIRLLARVLGNDLVNYLRSLYYGQSCNYNENYDVHKQKCNRTGMVDYHIMDPFFFN